MIKILNLHLQNKSYYKDDDLSLVKSFNNIKFIDGEKNNFKITNQQDLNMFKNFINRTENNRHSKFIIHSLRIFVKLFNKFL